VCAWLVRSNYLIFFDYGFMRLAQSFAWSMNIRFLNQLNLGCFTILDG
jgi:hypothetical protein